MPVGVGRDNLVMLVGSPSKGEAGTPTCGPPTGMSRGRGGYSGGPVRGGVPRGMSRGSSDGQWGSRGGMSRGRGSYNMHQSRGGGMSSGGSAGSGNWYNKEGPQQNYRNERYPSAGGRPNESRYPTSRGGSSGEYNNRYSRRDAPPSYSTREHHRSPDPIPRKRIRTEGYSPAGSRRSHDGGYEGSSSRYEYGSDKGSYSNEDRGRPVYREERRPSTDRRDDYHSPRSRDPSGPSMPPPSGPVRGSSYRSRGGGIRGRGVTRIFTRRPSAVPMAARSRSFIETYTAKRRILTGRTQDYYKKLKSIKLRSAALARREGGKSDEGDSGDELENWDDEMDDKEVLSENEGSHKDVDEETPEAEEEEKQLKKVVRPVVKKVVVKKKVAPSVKQEGGDEKETVNEDGGEDKVPDDQGADGDEEAAEGEADAENDGEPKMQVTIKQDSETRAVSDEGARKGSSVKTGYKFIKLFCPHCKERYVTFKDYQNHLRGLVHVNAMRKLSFRLKQNLARMRVEQRIQQRLEEKNDEIRGVTGARTNYCQTCKLNYRQDRTRHNESEMHKKMKEFLMPMCVVCRINFRSPMLYENHICSLDHIKMEEKFMKGRDREHATEKEVDMDSLLVLDSVGSADESDSDEDAAGGKSEGKDGEKKEKKKKAQINLGADYVKKVEVMYCELCAIYLPRTGEEDVALANHCRTRNHLQRYVRYKDDRALRKEAERIHRRDKAEQEARKAQEANNDVKNDVSSGAEKAKEAKQDSKSGKSSGGDGNPDASTESVDLDDKMWAEGLDELLREVEPGSKSSDDDDESGRYDRFRYSDKKSGKTSNEDDETPDTSSKSMPVAVDIVPKQETTSAVEK